MWPFSKKPKLPGIEQHADGRISLTLTDEEKAEVNSFFQMMKDSDDEQEEGDWFVHPDLHKAMTAMALSMYAQTQVSLVKLADEDAVDKQECLHKALAAAGKAYSLHALPVFMFDVACIFDMLGDNGSARDAFRSFLTSQEQFRPSDVDNIALSQRDVNAAIREARERIGETK